MYADAAHPLGAIFPAQQLPCKLNDDKTHHQSFHHENRISVANRKFFVQCFMSIRFETRIIIHPQIFVICINFSRIDTLMLQQFKYLYNYDRLNIKQDFQSNALNCKNITERFSERLRDKKFRQ